MKGHEKSKDLLVFICFVKNCLMTISYESEHIITMDAIYEIELCLTELVGSVSSPLCLRKLERICTRTQICQLRYFNDNNRQNIKIS